MPDCRGVEQNDARIEMKEREKLKSVRGGQREEGGNSHNEDKCMMK